MKKEKTPLFIVAQKSHIKMVKALLAAGANVNAAPASGDDAGATPLYVAAEKGHLTVVQELLTARDINVNATRTCKKFNGITPLFIASENGYLTVVQELLRAPGINVNAAQTSGDWAGITPLFKAAEKGHVKVVKLLLAKGANIEATLTINPDAHQTIDVDINKTSSLAIAAQHGYLDVVQELLNCGADPSKVDLLLITDKNCLLAVSKGNVQWALKALLK